MAYLLLGNYKGAIMEYNSSLFFQKPFLNKLCNFDSDVFINLFFVWENAISFFLNDDLTQLDPLVCENACHIRALFLTDIVNKYRNPKLRKQLKGFLSSLYEIIHKTHHLTLTPQDKKNTIENVITKYSLSFDVAEGLFLDLKYIINSHVLTLTKRQLPSDGYTLNEKTCHDKILKTGLVQNKAKCLILETQKELSKMSCNYMKSLAHDAGFSSSSLISIQNDLHGRSFLPQHPTGKIALANIIKDKKNVVLHVSRYVRGAHFDEVYYFFNSDSNALHRINTLPDNTPCVIFSGVVEYKKTPESQDVFFERLKKFSLELIFSANFAAHPQFSGTLRHTSCPYKEATNDSNNNNLALYSQFTSDKQFAETHGCIKNNPELLLLNHIYCDTSNKFKEISADVVNNKQAQTTDNYLGDSAQN